MSQVRISSAAHADLEEIWFYNAQDNVDAADKLIHAVVSLFSRPAARPQLGRQREELSPRLRRFPVGRYVVFYRPILNGVEIARGVAWRTGLPTII